MADEPSAGVNPALLTLNPAPPDEGQVASPAPASPGAPPPAAEEEKEYFVGASPARNVHPMRCARS